MKYSLFLKKTALKNLHTLPQKDTQKISLVLESLRVDPFTGKKLAGELQGLYSIRVWPYRIIYEVFKKELVVLIVDVAHRKDVYK